MLQGLERIGKVPQELTAPLIAEWVDRLRHQMPLSAGEISDDSVRETIAGVLLSSEELESMAPGELRTLADRIFLALRRDFYILEEYRKDPAVTEIMVNGPGEIYIERGGRMEQSSLFFESTGSLLELIRRLASRMGREINERNPILDARTVEGYRVNGVYHNLALGGPTLTIRKFPESRYTMEDLVAFGTLTGECAGFLADLVRNGYNIFISGGTSSGKTTFLNALTGCIPKEERVIVIEDSAELFLEGLTNVVRLECHQANGEGRGQVGMDRLIRTSLRMRPDRIIVGEVRGPEVADMINAMNTGHDGSLSTGHGNSVRGMVRRLESLFLQGTNFPLPAIRAQIAEGIDIMVHLARLPDGRRVVTEVTELLEEEQGGYYFHQLFVYRPGTGLIQTGEELMQTEKRLRKGGTDEL